MRSRRRAWASSVLALMLGIASGGAQAVPPGAEQGGRALTVIAAGTEDALHEMSRIAGVIFVGRVIAIRRHETIDGATGAVEIEFGVDDAIRGVSGGTYILREWGGLWPAGYEPFRVGERYLMLLHPPGASGLSSPVGGSDGAIPIRGGEEFRAAGVSALKGGAAVDLRWIATWATRTVAYRAELAAHTTSLPVVVRADAVDAGAARDVQVDVSGTAPGGAPAVEGAAYTTVVGLLRSWEKGDDAAR